MQKVSVLPQHIYTFECPPELIQASLENLDSMEFRHSGTNHQSVETYVLDRSGWSDLKKWAHECITKVAEEEGLNTHEWFITQSWVNLAAEGSWHKRHHHGNSLLSAILYLTDSPADTWFSVPTIWPSDLEHIFVNSFSTNPREIIHREPSQAGKLVIFPSKLDHSVSEHTGSSTRISLAFNAIPVGTFGSREGLTEVTYQAFNEN